MKTKQILGLSILTLLFSQTLARSYPITNIPIIQNADYEQYRHNTLYRQTYTMLQGATYYDGRDMGLGSHQGIDIAKPEGTQIQAIHDGTIILAELKGGRGRVITIEHEFQGQKIYSSYAHLQNIYVMVGEKIKEGEIIATVGKSGNSTGPHLHFQIEIKSNGEHPFFFKNCAGTISQIVNEGRCQNQMYEHTIDPILFLESNGEIIGNTTSTPISPSKINYEIGGFLGGILPTTQIGAINITSTETQILDEAIIFQYDKDILDLFPERIEVLTAQRKIFLTAKKEGLTHISIIQGGKILKEFPIYINANSLQITPTEILQIQQYNFYIAQLNDDKAIFFKYQNQRIGYLYHNHKFQKI